MGEQEFIEPEPVDTPTVAALAVRDTSSALVTPAAGTDVIRQAFEDYQRVCADLLTDDDYQTIGGKRFRKRSAWRKLAVAFGITFDIAERTIDRDAGRVVFAEFVVRALAPNGRYADGWGSCDIYERCCAPGCSKNHGRSGHCPAADGGDCPGWTHFSHANHDVPATAETRAKNRAAADLFGMGEVSAEEVGELGAQRERDLATQELDALLDTAEAMGLDVDADSARKYAAQSAAHARHACTQLRSRMDVARDADRDPSQPAGDDSEVPSEAAGADSGGEAGEVEPEPAAREAPSPATPDPDRRLIRARAESMGVGFVDLANTAVELGYQRPNRWRDLDPDGTNGQLLDALHGFLDVEAASGERGAA